MAVTYYLSATASDLTGGADFNQLLATATGTAGSVSAAVSAGATNLSFAWTGTGEPGTRGTSTGTFTVHVNVTSANANLDLTVTMSRVNSSGTVQSGPVTLSGAGTSLGSTGVKTFSATNPALGTWASGDRLRVGFSVHSSASHGNNSVSFETDTTSDDISTPFATAGQNFTQTPTDAAGLGDSPSSVHDTVAAFTDGSGLADTAAAALDVVSAQADGAGLADTAAAQIVKAVDASDAEGLTDVAAKDEGKGLTDEGGLADSSTVESPTQWVYSCGVLVG